MADNTETPKPPLPFGDTAGLPKQLIPRSRVSEAGFRRSDDLESVTDITSLMSARTYELLEVEGEIGAGTGPSQTPGEGDPLFTRLPFVLTCQSWIKAGRYIVFRANPSEVQWRMPQRSVQQKTRQGEVIHVWKDRIRNNTFYDEPQLTFTFQSGNIMPIRRKPMKIDEQAIERAIEKQQATGTSGESGDAFNIPPNLTRKTYDKSETEPELPSGLKNFYEFLDLVDEQKILDSGDVNFVYLVYNSRIFPSITLAGLFTPEGVSWTDSSDNPNQIMSWSANFTVYDSYPKMSNNLETLTRFFKSAGFGRI